MSLIDRTVQALARRVEGMIVRVIVTAANSEGGRQVLKVKGLETDLRDEVEQIEDYGFTSKPKKGADALLLSVLGRRSHGIIVKVGDRRYRLKGLADGEVAVYDDLGQKIVLTRTGIVVTAPNVTITADAINIGGDVHPAVFGDLLNAYLTTILSVSTAVGPSGPASVGLTSELSAKVKVG